MANLQVNQIRKHLTDNYIRFVDASNSSVVSLVNRIIFLM